MLIDELDYVLPKELIATEPPAQRDGARLMCLSRTTGHIDHRMVVDLPLLLPQGSLVVVNDTKVIPARIFAKKPTQGNVEIFLLRPQNTEATVWSAFGRASKPIRPETMLTVHETFHIRVEHREANGQLTVTLLPRELDVWSAIERFGNVPLPPYMNRQATETDKERYQTVFAQHPGAVAAPTAGLHLSPAILQRLKDRSIEVAAVTLHVGAGTFAPVEVKDLSHHPMHSEWYNVPSRTLELIQERKRANLPVTAVGTTVVRALESQAIIEGNSLSGETRLLIQPGFRFRVIDQLMTNFHLPKSTLLALVMAFASKEYIRTAYATAIEQRYKFYSYGDAMFIA